MKLAKRLFSVILALIMALTLIPVTVLSAAAQDIIPVVLIEDPTVLIEAEVTDDPEVVIHTTISDNDPKIVIYTKAKEAEWSYPPEAYDTDWGGSGTKDDPYIIKTGSGLDLLSKLVQEGNTFNGCCFALEKNITVGNVCSEELGSWTPIGSTTHPFAGRFDGRGFTVSDLYISGGSDLGLFGAVTGTISNLNVSGTVSGSDYCGGIASLNYAAISNCTFSGTIVTNGKYNGGITGFNCGTITGCKNTADIYSPGEQGGGIAGRLQKGSITNCVNEGDIVSYYQNYNAYSPGSGQGNGGIVGIAQSGSLSDCKNYGGILFGKHVGGIAGQTRIAITRCENRGNINTYQTGGEAGGIAGSSYSAAGTVTDCINYGSLTYKNYAADMGGIVGNNQNARIERCINNGSVGGSSDVGGIVGYGSGTIADCVNNGSVAGNNYKNVVYVGGISGRGSSITRCLNTGSVRADGVDKDQQGLRVGGIVGEISASGGAVSYCANTGHITSYADTGGIAGFLNNATVKNCYNTGLIDTTKDNDGDLGYKIGGVVGENWKGFIQDCYNTGTVKGNKQLGGVVGMAINGAVKNCYSIGSINADESTYGGILGYRWCYSSTYTDDILSHNYYAKEKVDQGYGHSDDSIDSDEIRGLANTEFNGGGSGTFKGWNFGSVWYSTEYGPRLYGVDVGSIDGEMEINSVDDLKKLRDRINSGIQYKSVSVKLMCDLDLSGENRWKPIGATDYNEYARFSGVFEGNNHSITGLRIDSGDDVGLFGVVDGTVKNLRVEGSVEGSVAVGGIAAELNGGTIENCTFIGSVKGDASVGGIAGVMRYGAEMRGCTCCADVKATDSNSHVGGMSGMASSNSLIEQCSFDGGLIWGYSNSGGIVGSLSNATVKNCFHTGEINGKGGDHVGGIAGYLTSAEVSCCAHYTGTVFGDSYVGGVAGYALLLSAGSTSSTLTTNYYLSGTVSAKKKTTFGEEDDTTDRGVGKSSSSGTGYDATDYNPSKKAQPLTVDQFRSWSSFKNWDSDVWSMGNDHPVLKNVYETVTFNANGGSGSMDDYPIPTFGGIVPGCGFYRSGYSFIAWNTDSDGSGEFYDPGDPIPGDQSFTLYAVWAQKDYIRYIDTDGHPNAASNCTGLNSTLTLLHEGWYYVDGNVSYSQRIEIDGNVNIILKDLSILNAPYGIHVPSDSSLTIWGQERAYQVPDSDAVTQGNGTLSASNRVSASGSGYSNNAAIGGNSGETPGEITFNGGVITAAAQNGAAIGSAADQNANSVSIFKACVTAKSLGGGSAAIGGGRNGSGGRVDIDDAYVNVVGSNYSQSNKLYASSAIGAGEKTSSDKISGASVGIRSAYVHAEAGSAGEDGVAARAIGAGMETEYDLGWIYPLSRVRAVDENDAPVTQDLIPYMCSKQSVDIKPCTMHVGCEDDLEKCRYCGVTSMSDVHFVVCNYNYPDSPKQFSYGTDEGGSFEVTDNIIGPEGSEFKGWSTGKNGSGSFFAPGETITPKGKMTLYAQWGGKKPVSYMDEEGVEQTVSAFTLTQEDTVLTEGWYVAEGELTFGERLTVNGDVKLILADDCTMTVNYGIGVPEDSSLTIYGQTTLYRVPDELCWTFGTGVLYAKTSGSNHSAAIGGNERETAGTVTINGGVITAQGRFGAGIGGGDVGDCGTVNINNGCVTATGDRGSAGIGGGGYTCGGIVNISGGYVKATGSVYSDTGQATPGIGSGRPRANGSQPLSPGTVNITGGTVIATAGTAPENGTGAMAIGVNLADEAQVTEDSLTIADHMRVTYGESADSAEISLFANRIEACRGQYARIEVCKEHIVTDEDASHCACCGKELPAEGVIVLGDADSDGEVTVIDATYIQRRLADLAVSINLNTSAADADGDGEVSVIDATYILRYLVRIKTPYPIGEPMS